MPWKKVDGRFCSWLETPLCGWKYLAFHGRMEVIEQTWLVFRNIIVHIHASRWNGKCPVSNQTRASLTNGKIPWCGIYLTDRRKVVVGMSS